VDEPLAGRRALEGGDEVEQAQDPFEDVVGVNNDILELVVAQCAYEIRLSLD